jgi:hypothetical protein
LRLGLHGLGAATDEGQETIAQRPDNKKTRMAIHLPRPIETYFESDTARDAEALASCFAADATVHDEGRTHEASPPSRRGRSRPGGNMSTRSSHSRPLNETARPLSPPESPATSLAARSPWRFIFALERDRIASLEIHS